MQKLCKKKKIVAVASFGGHWIQLLRIMRPLENAYDVFYVCTHKNALAVVGDDRVCIVPDFSRWNVFKIVPSVFRDALILMKHKPSTVLSTGAAPGLLLLLIAKYVFRKKTIWIDSIANAHCLSLCGKLAAKMGVDYVYTQWEHLSEKKVKFAGNVLG